MGRCRRQDDQGLQGHRGAADDAPRLALAGDRRQDAGVRRAGGDRRRISATSQHFSPHVSFPVHHSRGLQGCSKIFLKELLRSTRPPNVMFALKQPGHHGRIWMRSVSPVHLGCYSPALSVEATHPCQFPVALALRLVRSLCPKGGVVLDCFSGVASTGVPEFWPLSVAGRVPERTR